MGNQLVLAVEQKLLQSIERGGDHRAKPSSRVATAAIDGFNFFLRCDPLPNNSHQPHQHPPPLLRCLLLSGLRRVHWYSALHRVQETWKHVPCPCGQALVSSTEAGCLQPSSYSLTGRAGLPSGMLNQVVPHTAPLGNERENPKRCLLFSGVIALLQGR